MVRGPCGSRVRVWGQWWPSASWLMLLVSGCHRMWGGVGGYMCAGGGVGLTGPWVQCCHVQGVDVGGRGVVVCAGCRRGLIHWVWRHVSGAFGCRWGGGTDQGGSGGEVAVVDSQHFSVVVGVSGATSVGVSGVGGMVVLTGGVHALTWQWWRAGILTWRWGSLEARQWGCRM